MDDPIQLGETIIPVYDRVLVEVHGVDDKSKGGVLLPQEYTAKIQRSELRATIMSLGPIAYADLEEEYRPKIGDTVLIPKHAGQPYAEDGKVEYETRIIRSEEVLATIRKEL